MNLVKTSAVIALIAGLVACGVDTPATKTSPYEPKSYSSVRHAEWLKNAVIYQLNTRQFTEEGTFNAAAKQLPRIKELGADIVWLMPIHPIGVENRKGTVGSPYSVKDYFGVNPDLGTEDDFRAFVKEAHSLGLKVILDWVANHSAWDNPMRFEHPDWYEKDYKGDFRPTPWWDWSDIIDLDYSQPGLRKTMTEAMKYWVEEFDIDGYRCDVAGFVPLDFWENVRAELDLIKPVFMLAEWESRDMHRAAFNATYAWSLQEAMHDIVSGKAQNLAPLYVYYSWNESAYPREAMRMIGVSNHDMNAWEGTPFERYGDGLKPAVVLSVVGEGIPMIYSGQEAGNTKRLAFFEKDPIEWREHEIGDLYRQLFKLKHENSALWNAQWGARMVHVPNSEADRVLTFVRQNEEHKVLAVINFSDESAEFTMEGSLFPDRYTEYFTGERVELTQSKPMALEPWGYRVYLRES